MFSSLIKNYVSNIGMGLDIIYYLREVTFIFCKIQLDKSPEGHSLLRVYFYFFFYLVIFYHKSCYYL